MTSIIIETLTIPYKAELLDRWKEKNNDIVPSFMLDRKGPGVSNGYGFGEWMAEKYFRDQGYYIFNDTFDLISKKSKYKQYNKMIKAIIDSNKFSRFAKLITSNSLAGYNIENPDLFVFNGEDKFFVEVKKGRDRLREPQIRFMYLAKEVLDIESKMVYFCDKSDEIKVENIIYEFEIKIDFRTESRQDIKY
jgi:hypothetical protein